MIPAKESRLTILSGKGMNVKNYSERTVISGCSFLFEVFMGKLFHCPSISKCEEGIGNSYCLIVKTSIIMITNIKNFTIKPIG
jgi:hypothetical protein